MSLARKSYGEVADALSDAPETRLLKLFDSPSVKIGDTAADFLSRRGKLEVVAEHMRAGKFRTRNGRMRALGVVASRGKKFRPARELFVQCLEDRSRDVAGAALFYLVLWSDRALVSTILACSNPRLKEKIAVAARAIEEQDYRIYSPHFRADGRWKEEANQPPQRNAGSRPSSGDSSASETPSSLGPRG